MFRATPSFFKKTSAHIRDKLHVPSPLNLYLLLSLRAFQLGADGQLITLVLFFIANLDPASEFTVY